MLLVLVLVLLRLQLLLLTPPKLLLKKHLLPLAVLLSVLPPPLVLPVQVALAMTFSPLLLHLLLLQLVPLQAVP